MYVLSKIYEGYDLYFNINRDPRHANTPLMTSPFPLVIILGTYFWFVTKGGVEFMKNRQPFQLNTVMMMYNLFQVVSNLSLGIYGYYYTYWQDYYSFRCQPVNYTMDFIGKRELICTYLYFILKIIDLMDTVFMVLRKKHSHISFLHLYHHAGMVFGSYVCCRFLPGGHATLLGVINLFVHGIMYFYYFLTSFKPELKKSIWWKKHITQIQMLQFAILIFHFGRPAIFYYDCDYPKFWLWVACIQNLFMFILFSDFYRKAYLKKKPKVD